MYALHVLRFVWKLICLFIALGSIFLVIVLLAAGDPASLPFSIKMQFGLTGLLGFLSWQEFKQSLIANLYRRIARKPPQLVPDVSLADDSLTRRFWRFLCFIFAVSLGTFTFLGGGFAIFRFFNPTQLGVDANGMLVDVPVENIGFDGVRLLIMFGVLSFMFWREYKNQHFARVCKRAFFPY